MDNYELVAADVFQDEFDSDRTGKDYTEAEKAALNKLANLVETYYMLNRIPNPIVPGPMHPDYIENQILYHSKLRENFEKGGGHYPYFFYTSSSVFSFVVCYECIADIEDAEAYSLFLAFKLRNLSLHKLKRWLDGLLEKHSNKFLDLLEIHVEEYDYMYDVKWLQFIKDWMNQSSNQIRTSINPSLEEKSDETEAIAAKQVFEEQKETITEEPFNMDRSIVDGLVAILQPYFSEDDIILLPKVLKGEPLELGRKLLFKTSGNRFVEVFRQLYEVNKILCQKLTTCRFLNRNFQFYKSNQKTISDFKIRTVSDILSGKKNPLPKSKRIDLSPILLKVS